MFLLCGLGALGFAHPLVDLLARNCEFFTVHQLDRLDVLLLLAALVFVPAFLVALLSFLLEKIHQRLGRTLFFCGATLFLTAAGIPFIHALPSPWDFLATGLILVISGSLVYMIMGQKRLFGLWPWAGLIPWIIIALFILQPGPRSLLFPPKLKVTSLDQGGPQPDDSIPVVLVVFDAFPVVSLENRNHQVDEQLCPNLAAFHQDAVWYRNALSLSDNTLLSVPSILTGKQPKPMAQPNQVWHPYNLFTWLDPFRNIQAFESHTSLSRSVPSIPRLNRWQLTLSDLSIVFMHLNLPDRLRQSLPSVTQDWIGFAQEKSAQKGRTFPGREVFFQDFLASLSEGQEPACYFLHSVFPHTPYQYLPSGKRYTRSTKEPSGEGKQWGKWSMDADAVVHSRQRHLYQVGYVDNLVGQILQELKNTNRYDDALIIITADHGVSFRPGDTRRKLSPTNLGDILCVPLFVKYPGTGAGHSEDRPVHLTDILPTVAEVLKVPLPWETDGISLLDSDSAPAAISPFVSSESKDEINGYEVSTILQQRQASLQSKFLQFPSQGPNPSLANPFRPAEWVGVKNPKMSDWVTNWTISLDGPLVRNIDPVSQPFFPAVVSGTVSGETALGDSIDIVILVDGRVAGFSHPYDKNGKWSLLLSDRDLCPGDHQLSLALVDWSRTPPAFFSVTPGMATCLGANLLLEERFEKKMHGLHRLGQWDGVPSSWTDGAAHFAIQVPDEDEPRFLNFELLAGSPRVNSLAILVNGEMMWSGIRESFPFRGTIPLPPLPESGPCLIDVLSSTHVPAEIRSNTRDRRRLGVVLSNLEFSSQKNDHSLPEPKSLRLVPGQNPDQRWQGLYSVENWGGRPVAWTHGQATCAVAWPSDFSPRSLVLDVVGTSPAGTDLKVQVNGVEVLVKESVIGPWQTLVDLPDLAPSDSLVVRLNSSTFVPAEVKESGDQRPLGIALRQVILIPDGR